MSTRRLRGAPLGRLPPGILTHPLRRAWGALREADDLAAMVASAIVTALAAVALVVLIFASGCARLEPHELVLLAVVEANAEELADPGTPDLAGCVDAEGIRVLAREMAHDARSLRTSWTTETALGAWLRGLWQGVSGAPEAAP